jgi:hypothetical protein
MLAFVESRKMDRLMKIHEEYPDIVDWEDGIKDWDKYYEKWYNKYIVIPIGNAYRRSQEVPDRIKYFIQRGRRCWSNEDAWAIDHWLVSGLIPMLERLRQNKLGTPSNMIKKIDGIDKDGRPTDKAYRLAEQRWGNILGEIIYGLKCAKMLQDLDYDYDDKKLSK